MSGFDYDLFVIGGGSGGVRAARVAAQETGAKVALAEESRYGGTCVIRGCVPKKLMVFAASFSGVTEEARAYGWEMEPGRFDWGRFRPHLHAELDRLEGVYRKLLANAGVTTYDARARLNDAHTVELSSGETVTARHILIATGGRSVRPAIPNAELGLVSDDIFDLETLPKSILIIGGGYIACEFACILNGMGVEVTQYYRGAQILRGFDDEARGLVAEMMHDQGIDLHVGTDIVEMCRASERGDAGSGMGVPTEERGAARTTRSGPAEGPDEPICVTASNGRERNFDAVLFATGRRPNTDDMGLDEAGVTLARGGAVKVDDHSQTSVDHIYAIGDVTDRVNLTPVAIREGMAFVETVFKDNPTPVDHAQIPTAIFTRPELGCVGMTEEEARDQEEIEVYCTSFRPMKTAFADHSERVMMKLVVSKETRKVLGCHIVAPEAGEMIQMAGIAVKMGATKEDFDRTCAVHPTMSEEIVTMRSPVRTG